MHVKRGAAAGLWQLSDRRKPGSMWPVDGSDHCTINTPPLRPWISCADHRFPGSCIFPYPGVSAVTLAMCRSWNGAYLVTSARF